MSRPVGAAGAGCGGAGLLGILASVGIVVWLGSMSLGGSGSGGTDRSTTSTLAAPPTPVRVEATRDPAGPLVDGTKVVVSARLGAGPATAWTCLASGPTTVPLTTRCADETTLASHPGDDAGHAAAGADADADLQSATVAVHRRIEVDGATTDCGAAPGVCVLVLRLDDGSRAAVIDLTFAS